MNERYTTDVKYPTTYFHFQTPVIMSSVALLTGHAHRFPGSEFTYCDFGCGQGYMLSLLAACNPDAKFFGVDLNPAHIESAQKLVDQFGLDNVMLINADFEELKPDDLPDLDYAAITGVYSWLPMRVRARLIDYVSGRLKAGGLCFLHYLSMPGFGRTLATTALTQLLAEHQAGDSAARALAAVTELHDLLDCNPQLPFNKSSPETRATLKRHLKKDPGDLAHDILNRDLQPLWFHSVAKMLGEYGLAYIGHAVPNMNSFADLQPNGAINPYNDFCKNYDDPILREEMLGLLLDLPVRMDIFGKGFGVLAELEASCFSNFRAHSLVGPHHEITRRQINSHFLIDLLHPIYSEILEDLSEHSKEAAHVFEKCAQKHGASKARQALLHLVSINLIAFGAESGAPVVGEKHLNPSKFSKHVLFDQLSEPGMAPVPSVLLSSCIKVSHLDRVLFAVLLDNNPEDVWSRISQGTVQLRGSNNQPISDYDAFCKFLPGAMQVFKASRLPELLKLGILSS